MERGLIEGLVASSYPQHQTNELPSPSPSNQGKEKVCTAMERGRG
jgi:hypothetical protein